MKRYRIAAIIIIIHGIIELGGFFAVLPLWLGVEQSEWVPFAPPEPAVVIGGVIWGVLRIIGAVGLLKNLKWGLALSMFTSATAIMAMFEHMPFGIMDAILGGIALILMLTQYFGKKKATEEILHAVDKKDFASITNTYLKKKELQEKLAPFFWVEHEAAVSVCLYIGEFKNEIFQMRSAEGFEGNGYDWGSLAQVFIDEKMPELKAEIGLDPEAGMFCAYSQNAGTLQRFAIGFREMCNDDNLMRDLFSRAELD